MFFLSLSIFRPGHNMDNAEHDPMGDDMDDANSVAAGPSQDMRLRVQPCFEGICQNWRHLALPKTLPVLLKSAKTGLTYLSQRPFQFC